MSKSKPARSTVPSRPLVLLRGEKQPQAIIAACARAMFVGHWPLDEIQEFRETAYEAKSLSELIEVCRRNCDVTM